MDFVGASIQAAANLGEAINKTDVIFGSSSEAVKEFAATSTRSLAISERAALEAISTFGNLTTSMGISQKTSADLSINLTRLASDLSSLNNISPEEAFIALRAALVGETEPIRRLGVNINQASLEAEAARLGFTKLGDTLDPQAKLWAAYSLSVQQTTNAQGDLANTLDSLPNQMRVFSGEIENLQAHIGEGLLPQVGDLLVGVNDLLHLLNSFGDVAENFQKNSGTIGKGLAIIKSGLTPTLGTLFKYNRVVLDGALGLLGLKDATEEYASAQDLLAGETPDATTTLEQYKDAVKATEDAHRRLNRAIQDSERSVDNAERAFDRAVKDAEVREDKSERSLQEAIKDRVRTEHEANQRIADVDAAGKKRIRSAAEALEDFNRKSTERQIADEERLLDLRRKHAEAITDATIAVEDAQVAGDAAAFNAAQRELGRAQHDSSIRDTEAQIAVDRKEAAIEQDRLERDLAEAEKERQKDLIEAREDKAQAIEDANKRVADSERDLAETERQNLESVEDAQRRLNEARRQGNEHVDDARRALDKLEDKVHDILTLFNKINRAIDETLSKLGELGRDPNADDEVSKILQGNAGGGTIAPGELSWVGERGPELAFGGRTGATIFNNDSSGQFAILIKLLTELLGGGGPWGGLHGSSTNIPHVTIMRSGGDDRVLANELAWSLMRGVVR